MATIEDRVTRLETINEQQMSKVVDGLEAVVLLREDAKENKEFRKKFEDKAKEIVDERLNTTTFDNAIKTTVEQEIYSVFNKPEVREDFTKKVSAIVRSEFEQTLLKVYLKMTAIVATIALGVATVVAKGWV